MVSVSVEVHEWYESLKNQKLSENDKSTAIWNKYKSDLEVTKSLLSVLPKEMSHKVMVPIGPRALMPGRIVHTNEFLVNLGETWFAKRTASQTMEICNRRIKKCDEMIEKFEKEKELIDSKSNLPAQEDAFGSKDRPEIIEYVTEEENEEWKKQHRIKEKEYKQKLAQLRAQEKKEIQTEEDLWKHLDELELQEELEDELNRLSAEQKDLCCNESNSDNESEDSEVPSTKAAVTNTRYSAKGVSLSAGDESGALGTKNTKHDSPFSQSIKDETKKRKVSFADFNSSDEEEKNNEPLRLKIKFTNIEPVHENTESLHINSPGDIYSHFIKLTSESIISVPVLKSKVNPNKDKEFEKLEREKLSGTSESENDDDDAYGKTFKSLCFKDVVERNPFTLSTSSTKETSKKLSKFKASRMKTS